MKCQSDIEQLADEKLRDAELLLANKAFNSAYYLAGYVIELLLKAKVCKNLTIDDLFDFENNKLHKGKSDSSLSRSLKVHNFDQLLILSGLYSDFENQIKDIKFKGHWSIINKWNEGSRYLTGKSEKDTIEFITSIKVIQEWLLKNL